MVMQPEHQATRGFAAGHERAPGFYWIRFSDGPEIGFWDEEAWIVLGSDTPVADAEVVVLGARLEPPE
jgi:hypothetical protein